MPLHDDSLAERERRLDEVVTAYLQDLGSAQAPDRQALCARHPDLAEELAEFFTFQDWLYRLATPLRCVARAAEQATPLPNETLSADDSESPVSAEADREFGGYELLGRVGAGGMGVVYRARQKSPNRLVALKIIRMRTLASADEVRRFRAEAETAASLDHPHVVPVHEVSEHEGQLFYSMRLMEGGSLAGQLERFRDDPRSAARLVATVARTVHHAHQRGILHRDLKPSNILLDGEGQPHVSDFGLAKRVEADASLTQTGAIVGTPQYMAPEQTRGQKGAVTTTTDVYGLGAVLYALLSGRPPFQGETVLETLEQVRECEPEPPRRINRKVDRDLETICLKCLQKEPQRRYESAQALAEDLERWLGGEPIQARAISRSARLWRWCRRNPLGAGLVVMAALVVIVLAVSSALLWQEKEQKQRAYEAEAEQRQRADANYRAAEEQRRQARKAVDEMYTEVAAKWLENQPNLTDLQRQFLEKALQYYEGFAQQEGVEAELRVAAGAAYARVGQIQQKLGHFKEAEQAFRRRIALYEKLAAEFPTDARYQSWLTLAHNDLANLLADLGQHKQAEAEYREMIRIQEKLVADYPAVLRYRRYLGGYYNNLAELLHFTNPTPEAEEAYRKAIQIYSELSKLPGAEVPGDESRVAMFQVNFANYLGERGRHEEAEKLCRQAAGFTKKIATDFPEQVEWKYRLGLVHQTWAEALYRLRRHEEEARSIDQAIKIFDELAAQFPKIPEYRLRQAYAYGDLGRHLMAQDRLRPAEKSLVRSVEILAQLASDWPMVPLYRRQLSDYGNLLAFWLAVYSDGQLQEAPRIVVLAKKAVELVPEQANPWRMQGLACYRTGDWKGAIAALRKSTELRSDDASLEGFFLSMAYFRRGDKLQARQWYDRAVESMEKHNPPEEGLVRNRAEAAALLGLKVPSKPSPKPAPKK